MNFASASRWPRVDGSRFYGLPHQCKTECNRGDAQGWGRAAGLPRIPVTPHLRRAAVDSSPEEATLPTMIPFLTSWGPAGAWIFFIFVLSAQSDLPGAGILPFADKVGHSLLFGVLGAALAYSGRLASGKHVHVGLVLKGWLFAVSDEGHQAHVPGRDPSWGDVLADVVGILAGFALARTLLRQHSGPRTFPSESTRRCAESPPPTGPARHTRHVPGCGAEKPGNEHTLSIGIGAVEERILLTLGSWTMLPAPSSSAQIGQVANGAPEFSLYECERRQVPERHAGHPGNRGSFDPESGNEDKPQQD